MAYSSTENAPCGVFALIRTSKASTGLNHVALPTKLRETGLRLFRVPTGIPCHIGYPWPLSKNPVFQQVEEGPKGCPFTCPYYGKQISIKDQKFPVTEKICSETVVIPHEVLLSTRSDMDDIVAAITKIKENASELL